jgi:hypothetical protein
MSIEGPTGPDNDAAPGDGRRAPAARQRRPLIVAAVVLVAVVLGVAAFGALRGGTDGEPGSGVAGPSAGVLPEPAPGRRVDGAPGGPQSGPTGAPPAPSPDGSDPARSGSATKAPAGAATGGHVVSARLDDRKEVTLDVVSSASTLTLRAADLGRDLYRVETPVDGALLPRADDDAGRVTVRLEPAGVQGPGSVTMVISSKVAWRIRLAGAVAEQTVDLSGGRITALEVAGGSGKVDVTLPRPSGTLPVTMSGGVGELLIHVPRGFPVQARIGSGAGTVTVDGAARSNVTPGTLITPAGWGAATDRYDVNAAAGLSTLTVDRR